VKIARTADERKPNRFPDRLVLASKAEPRTPKPSARLTGLALGIDVGGSGIKAAVVDVATGMLVTDRVRVKTPHPATRQALLATLADVVGGFEQRGSLMSGMSVGVGFPSVIKSGRATTATNLDPSWIGAPVREILTQRLGRPIQVLNDADAAGLAEVAYGAGTNRPGIVLLLALGTGIGSALFVDGRLVPNLQLGHVEFRGRDAERQLSATARKRRDMSLKKWAHEFNELLAHYEECLWPDLIILGGGMVRAFPRFARHLRTNAPLVPAAMGNDAGIVGAARIGIYADDQP
jgi:polyphosphate glucokinase